MNIRDYLGLRYDIQNRIGINCWGLYALVKLQEQGVKTKGFSASSGREAAAIFAAQLATGEHGLTLTESPKDFDLVLMQIKKKYHCGIMWAGGVLHAKGTGRRGSVCYDLLNDLKKTWAIRFYYDNNS